MMTVVLKFGGSVLADEASLRGAVHEIYRWRRDGYCVVAVVSAFVGRTLSLSAEADRAGAAVCSSSRAALVTLGEFESAARLGLQLERAGLRCLVLDPGAVSLRTLGPALDASPCGVVAAPILEGLSDEGIVVFPGYCGVDARGRRTALGTGGSDLTAVFLASALGAQRCRLIKDVDGLYESDPAGPGPLPRRYRTASYADALATDGSILQHRAVEFAREHSVEIELGALNSLSPTLIGPVASVTEAARPARDVLRVGICGHGTVGGGVAELLREQPSSFELVGVCVRNPLLHGAGPEFVRGLDELFARGPDVVVELTGDGALTDAVASRAFSVGIGFVTANKAWVASAGGSGAFRCSAAAGGVVPVVEAMGRGAVLSLEGILCGTANYVLESMRSGSSLAESLDWARALGLAEADASRDLDGRDAADKLCVLARRLGVQLEPSSVLRDVITSSIDPSLRQVARLACEDGVWSGSVRLVRLDPSSPLLRASAEENVVVIQRVDGTSEVLHGKGAGRWPTAEAVMVDLWEIARERQEVAHGVR